MCTLKKRQRLILSALREMPGGLGTTKEIAEKTGLHVNGVAQTLGALNEYVEYLNGKGGNVLWRAYGVPADTNCATCGHERKDHVSNGCI